MDHVKLISISSFENMEEILINKFVNYRYIYYDVISLSLQKYHKSDPSDNILINRWF